MSIHHLLNNGLSKVSRQDFLQTMALGIAGSMTTSCQTGKVPTNQTGSSNQRSTGQKGTSPFSPPATVPQEVNKPIELEPIKSDADRKTAPVPTPLPPDQRVGYALVGLGHLTLEELLPAFAECKKSKPVALVSGSPDKLQKVAAQYGIKPTHCYNYESYDQLKNNADVQAIYIVLPNSMHAEYTIRGAQAGKHILCEKPMANSSAECRAMIDACQRAQRKLMIAYRIQYEPYNRYLREQIRQNTFGKAKFIEAFNGQASANPKHWRHIKALAGGGALPDIGLYCLNTLRFVLGEEPIEVFGYQYSTPGNPLFREVEEMMSWQMRFPSGIVANCATDYNVHEARRYRVMCERGWLNLDNGFAYEGQALTTSRAKEQQVIQEHVKIAAKNQFATEIDHFSDCILHNRTPYTPGEEGLQDQRIIEAIYQSAQEGRPVKLPLIEKRDAFRGTEPQD